MMQSYQVLSLPVNCLCHFVTVDIEISVIFEIGHNKLIRQIEILVIFLSATNKTHTK